MASNMCRTAEGSVTLAVTENAHPPAARIAPATASACSECVLVLTATVRPSAARRSAMTAPRPLPAPVTSAISGRGSAITRYGLGEQLRHIGQVVQPPAAGQQAFCALGPEDGADQLAELRVELVVVEWCRRGAAIAAHLCRKRQARGEGD